MDKSYWSIHKKVRSGGMCINLGKKLDGQVEVLYFVINFSTEKMKISYIPQIESKIERWWQSKKKKIDTTCLAQNKKIILKVISSIAEYINIFSSWNTHAFYMHLSNFLSVT